MSGSHAETSGFLAETSGLHGKTGGFQRRTSELRRKPVIPRSASLNAREAEHTNQDWF
ncbi:hypothetical protein ABE021_06425 [Sporosarcina gallistercoris]|uniref:hypothetical protein n=1 Tax=Sporosarcina gallistercoris TaxID=2762245 RepID=UPI003D2B8271